MALSFLLGLFFVLLVLSGLFSFLETAFTALRLYKLKELERSVMRYHNFFVSWEKNPQRILVTLLVANNFVNILASVIISHIMENALGPVGVAFGVAIATILILTIGEIIPKSFAKTRHEKLFASFLWIMVFLYKILYPFVTVLLKLANFVFLKIGGPHLLAKQEDVSEKEIEFLIDYSDEKGLIEAEKVEMLQNVFSLGETQVKEIIIPEDDITSISVKGTIEEAMKLFCQTRYTRILVYDGKQDNVIGMIHQKDLLDLITRKEKKLLKELVRPILFVPDTQRVNQLLSEFLRKRMHMALVINEYGNIVGLVTLEDILEEIVGDIADEHDKISARIVPLEDGGWIVEGSIDLEELEDLLNINFETENSVTLAGFLAEKLQHVPKKGERLVYEEFCFQVQQASRRRVYQILVFKDESVPGEKKELKDSESSRENEE